MKKLISLALTFISVQLFAQTIDGPIAIFPGDQATYYYTGTPNGSWTLIGSPSLAYKTNETSEYVTIVVTGTSGFLTLWYGSITKSITVYSVPPAPPQPQVVTTLCGQTNIEVNTSTQSENVDWYWQTTPNGQSTALGSGYIYGATTTGTYYLQARSKTGNQIWGETSSGLFVTVNGVPTAPATNGNSSCGPGTMGLVATPGSYANSARWYAASSGGSVLATTTSWTTPSLSTTTTYYVSSYNTSTGCESLSRTPVTATVNTQPYSGELISGNGANKVCVGNNLQITVQGSTGTPYWWISSTNSSSNWDRESATTTLGTSFNYNFNSEGTWKIRVHTQLNGCWAPSYTEFHIDVLGSPVAPVATPGARCGPGSVTLSATPGYNANNVRWYDVETGGSVLSTSNSYSTYSISATKTFFVASYIAVGTCDGPRVPVVATVNPLPSAPAANTIDRCGPGVVNLTTTPGSGGTSLNWYNASTGGTLVRENNLVHPTSSISVPTTFYAATLNTTTGCVSDTRVAVTGNPTQPGLPTVNNQTIACGSTVTASGAGANETYKWYTHNGTDYSFLTQGANSPVTAASVTYHVSKFNSVLVCEGPKASMVVTVTAIGAPTVSNVTANYNTSVRLQPSGAVGGEIYRWYLNGSLEYTGAYFDTPLLDSWITLTYTVARFNPSNGCETPPGNRVSQTITVVVPDPVHPGASLNTCEPRKLTLSTPPSGVTWYLQTVPNGTSTDTPLGTEHYLAETGTYYIRAKGGSVNLWSNSIQLSIQASTVNPVELSFSSYQATSPNVRATYKISLLPGFTVTPGQTFSAKIEISDECNQFINWHETIAYDQNGQVAHIRNYTDGNGELLQSMLKDFEAKRMMASVPIRDYYGQQKASTLAAPILESDFIYKSKFATDVDGNPYSYDDFDKRTATNVAGSGEVNYPAPMGAQPGTVGWYYSSNNTTEPLTPTTQFPYSRGFSPEGPDPKHSASAGPGDAYRMGSTHEVKSDKSLIEASELAHYYSIRPFFVSSPPPGTNVLTVNPNSTTGFSGTAATVTSSNGYINVLALPSGGSQGVFAGGAINVTPNKKYVLSVRGYVPTGEPLPTLFVKVNAGASLVLPGPALPHTNEDWVSSIFTVPGYATQINAAVNYYTSTAIGNSSDFFISAFELREAVPSDGYKYISTDPNGKRSVSFVDGDGRTVATAIITSVGGPPYTYDYWSYTYYNDAGAVVATVAPKDVNTALFTQPIATTFKYDQFGRLIETTSPDEGTSRFLYSTDGKIRFSENQVQRDASPKRFSYTNYDRLGRPIESGEYVGGGSTTHVFEPHTTPVPAMYSLLPLVDNIGFTGVSQIINTTGCQDYTFVTYDIAGSGSPATQEYLYGQVSKTENANATTWYSYDEVGRVKWTIQSIVGLGAKRIDYTYDFLGNVTEVAYEKSGATNDKFYHHYEYDINQRLSKVYTSLDGSTKTLQATYKYYLHGPLKRVELAGNLQGVDYVYTIDGALKSINHSDPARDPGADGSNGFSADVFGQMLNYHTDDYTGAGYSSGSISASGIPDQYNGLIKYNSWFTPIDNPTAKKVYGYTYDNVDQLQNAQYSNLTGTLGSYNATFNNGAYREGVTGYDKNGNINGLVRNNNNGAAIANYSYTYNSGKNSLATVTGGANAMTYTHNSIGQMTQQVEGSMTTKVFYNASGLVKEIQNASDQPLMKYYYDDGGNRVKTELYHNTNLIKTTFYVSDVSGNVMAIYDNVVGGSVVKREVPIYGSGRIGVYKPSSTSWFYELSDHLGNVRAVIGPPTTKVYTATMESEVQAAEDAKFKNIAPRVPWVNGTVTPPAVAGNEAVRLNDARITGPGIKVTAAPGDVITAEVYAYYEGCSNCGGSQTVATIINSVAAAFGGVSGGAGESGRIYDAINGRISGGFAGGVGSGNNALPAAYLNLITFNNNLDVPNPLNLPMAAVPITTAANMQKQKLTIGPITIPTAGYVYIYVNNNSTSSTFVYFDDLKVTHVKSPFVSGADYYPFGMEISDREILTEPYRFGYQGQYSEEDSVTNWNAFDLRMYDPRIGRWVSPDPYGQFASPYVGMGNIPVSGVDPDGGIFIDPRLIEYLMTTTFLEEAVVSTSKIASVVGSALRNAATFARLAAHQGKEGPPQFFYFRIEEWRTNNIFRMHKSQEDGKLTSGDNYDDPYIEPDDYGAFFATVDKIPGNRSYVNHEGDPVTQRSGSTIRGKLEHTAFSIHMVRKGNTVIFQTFLHNSYKRFSWPGPQYQTARVIVSTDPNIDAKHDLVIGIKRSRRHSEFHKVSSSRKGLGWIKIN